MFVRAAALCLIGALACGISSTASAAPPVHGAVDARGLFDFSGREGAALGADFWWGQGVVRAGVGLGVGALTGAGKASSRVFTPVGLSLSLGPTADDRSGPTAILRAGVFPGAETGGFIFGGWGSCALGYRIALGEGASLRLGADGWLLLGHRGGLFWGPFVGLGF